MMKHLRSKSKAIVALVLMLTIAATMVALPATTAQEYRTKKTYAMCGLTPNPIGVGQEVLVWLGITDYLESHEYGWKGLTVTVERPDGTTETLGPFNTDATGSTGTVYVPATVGTYYFQSHFPAQWFNWTVGPLFDPDIYGDIWYEASDSEKVELVVQQDPVEYYPRSELPTEYWTRPIDAQHREWSSIAGNWLTTPPNLFAPYNDGPESAHILWAKPITYGGLAGGEMGDHAFDCGDAYQGKFVSSVIIAGVLYYNVYAAAGFGGETWPQGIKAVDLRTGEELWFKNGSRLAFGQVFYWDSYNMHSVEACLFEVTSTFDFATFTFIDYWHALDPFTGNWLYTFENVPTGGIMFGASNTIRGPKGEIYIYTVDLEEGWMTMWNSSSTVAEDGSWTPWGRTFDAKDGEEWNVTIPTGLPGSVRVVLEDRIIGNNATGWTGMGDNPIEAWCISTKPGQEGTLMWQETWQPPLGELSVGYGGASLEDGVFIYEVKETRQYYGFSIDTGRQIWGPTESQEALGIFGMESNIAYGKLFSSGMHGNLYCYDAKTGDLEWTYTARDHFTEILWSNNWPIHHAFITDGKIYMQHHEHSPIDPKPRGAPFICIDIETGEEIWSLPIRGTSWGGDPIIGDSIIAMYNSYDQRIYALGKGPSATTVTGPDTVVPLGTGVIIKGTVTDQSPGAKDTPAIADEDMSEWMKYVYLQFPIPADATGVEVTLDAIDPNGNYINIGTTTSDMSGTFSYMWTPEIEGKYTIFATFMGSKSYWPSYAETAIGVGPTPPEPVTPAVQEDIDESINSLTPMFLGIIVAVAIAIVIGILNLWALRKRA